MQPETFEFTVERAGERLDKLIVARRDDLSRAQVQTLIKDGNVTVNEQSVKAGVKLRGGETIHVTIPVPQEVEIKPEAIDLKVVYEDESIAVIDKAAGMVVHPGVGNESGTLVHAILARWTEIDKIDDPDGRKGIVHRLDKDTSGLIVIAKDRAALDDLMQQFQERTVDKHYLALLERTPQTNTGRVDAPIGRDPKQRKRMAVVRDGKSAITEFEVLDDQFRAGHALVRFDLLTGRTHQIRVHAAFIGCPIVGDQIYGFRKQRLKMKRNFLHSAHLAFDHPVSEERMAFDSELPVGLKNVMEKLR